MGEADYEGLITEENLNQCIASNFGDIHPTVKHNVLNYERVRQNIVKALSNPPQSFHFTEKIQGFYDSQLIAEKVLEIYRSLRMQNTHKSHIPVLMYHKVLNEERSSKHRIYVHVKRFHAHMRSLKKRKFTPLTFKDYLAFRSEQRDIKEFPKKPVIITFDDGYVNNLILAFPILQKFQFKAVVFALGDMSVRNNAWDIAKGEPEDLLMDAEQLKILSDAGIEIGAHSLSHRDLTKLSPDEAYREITESKLN